MPASAGSCRSPSLSWLVPDAGDERARLDRWCAGVGGALAQASPAGTPASVSMRDMTFASWNVHVGNGDLRRFVGDLRRGALTGGRSAGEFVILVQEAVRTGDVPPLPDAAAGAARIARTPGSTADIVQLSRDLGLALIYVPSMRNGRRPDEPAEDRGSAILSTLPLSKPTAIELPGERQRRVVILASAGPVSVGVVHLDALGGRERLGVFWTPWMRERQIRTLAPHLPDGPLVLGADLNTWHGRDERAARLLERLFRSTAHEAEGRGLGFRTLDYLFIRASGATARYRRAPGDYGSDHRPLVGWIE